MDVSIITMEGVLREACEAIELQHTEADGTLYAQLPADAVIVPGDSVGFADISGRYRLFEITSRELRMPEGLWEIHAVDKAIRELMDEPVTDVRARDATISSYLTRLLASTRFSVGTLAVNPTGTTTGYYESVWSAMAKAMTAYSVRLVPYYTLTSGLISGRYVDILSSAPTDKGVLFELGDNLSGLSISYDDSQIKTALFGRGQGVEIDSGDSSDPAYGRRLTFADVVWRTASGDPVDKPADQEWVGDPDALAMYGRDGRHRYGYVVFDQETDAESLLEKTWDALQSAKQPIISITGTIRDASRILGHEHETVQLGDTILVRMTRTVRGEKVTTDIQAAVADVIRDYVQPEETRITIGNATATAGSIIRQLTDTIDNYESRAAVWDRANAFDLQGVMDVMNNQIISTTGSWYTDPDTGAIMLVSTDGTMAMRLTGAGWQIASSKVSGVWQWRTAATGSGLVADQITTGTLSAALVKILGDAQFYWDSTNIHIVNPSNTRQIIRIGKYDGTNYGIGFSSDGGSTWTASMDFNGVIATSIGALTISAEKITSGTLDVARLGAGTITLAKLLSSTSSGDGITKLSNAGIEIAATSIGASAKTTIKADGLKMYNAAGTLIGGITTLNNVVTSIIQTLYNASYPNFAVDIGQFVGVADAVYGLMVKYAGTGVLRLGAGFIEGSMTGAEIVSDSSIIMISNDSDVTIAAGDSNIIIEHDGDILFTGTKNGTTYTVSMYDVYRILD